MAGSDEARGGFTDQGAAKSEEASRVAPPIKASEDAPGVDVGAELTHSVEEFEMDDGGSESHAAEDDPHASIANQ